MFVVCKEHLELAIDRFVDEFEDAPDLIDLKQVHFSAWQPPETCEDCKEPARFLVI